MYALCDRIFSVSIFIGNKKTLNNIRYTGHQYLQTTEKVSSYTNHSLFIDPRIGPESLAKVLYTIMYLCPLYVRLCKRELIGWNWIILLGCSSRLLGL